MKEPTTATGPVRFGPFEADISSGELRKQGLRIKLPDQSFQVLAMLLERPWQVVTRKELHKKLWPTDTFVDFDHGLNNTINRLREALGDSADNPRFVETLPKRGYRFIASVEQTSVTEPDSLEDKSSTPSPGEAAGTVIDAPAETPSVFVPSRAGRVWQRLGIFALALAALLGLVMGVSTVRQRLAGRAVQAAIRSIAVLPLENLSHDPEQEYFADGMTDALITDLAQIGSLKVISRTSVMRYKSTRKPLPEIAKELNVDGIVEGVVVQSNERVRVDAQLIEANTDRHFWARSYERSLGDVVALQSEIARAIANEIQVKLTPEEQARLLRTRPVDPQTYELYLRGLYFLGKRGYSDDTVRKSIDYFQQAIQRDPNYAPAYAGMAGVYIVRGDLSPKEKFPKARAMAEKALQLDEDLAEAHVVLTGPLALYDWDWAGAEKEFQRAIALNPNCATAYHAHAQWLKALGRKDWTAENTRAHELDPLSGFLGPDYYFASGQYDLAIEAFRKRLEIDPNSAGAYLGLGRAYERKGMYQEAIAQIQKGVSLSGGNPGSLASLGYTYALSGKRVEARKILKQLAQLSKRRYVSPYSIAMVYVGLGEKDLAFDWLEKALADRSGELVTSLRVDERMDTIRSDSRYAELLRRMGLPP